MNNGIWMLLGGGILAYYFFSKQQSSAPPASQPPAGQSTLQPPATGSTQTPPPGTPPAASLLQQLEALAKADDPKFERAGMATVDTWNWYLEKVTGKVQPDPDTFLPSGNDRTGFYTATAYLQMRGLSGGIGYIFSRRRLYA